jgi:hypothetical protein
MRIAVVEDAVFACLKLLQSLACFAKSAAFLLEDLQA